MAKESADISKSNEILVSGAKRKRRLKIILISIAITLIVLAGVITLVILLRNNSDDPETGEQTGTTTTTTTATATTSSSTTTSSTTTTTTEPPISPPEEYDPITLEDIIQGNLTPTKFAGVWTSDTEYIYRDDDNGNIMQFNAITGATTELLNTTSTQILSNMVDFELSPDGSQLMVAWDYRKLYRHSYTARYTCVDLETLEETEITPNGVAEAQLQLFVWGPNGSSLAFVYLNNIYYKPNVKSPEAVEITTDGIDGVIYNGVPDWVYEEEILSSNKAIWFSPSGNLLAYASFNDTLVQVMNIPYYGRPGDLDYRYTRHLQVRYPKAGTPNPIVNVHLVDLQNDVPSFTKLDVPGNLTEPVLSAVTFGNDSNVAVVWMDRIQNRFILSLCSNTECSEIFDYKESDGWVDPLLPMTFNSAGTSFVTILPQAIETDSWRQVVQISKEIDTNIWTLKARTSVPKTVLEILRWDEANDIVWFLATTQQYSERQHLYRVNEHGEIYCFTCNILHSSGEVCLYNEAIFSKNGGLITITCSGPQIPEVYLYNTSGERIRELENNTQLAEVLGNRTMPSTQIHSVPVAQGSIPAQVSLLTPPNLDTSGNTKYPLLVNVYGGPDSYQVLERWSLDWGASLVSRFNIIVANIDGRGSGLRGNNNLFALYKKLGTVEVEDQISATKYLQDNFDYVDKQKTCIWGWSYGGYAAAMALARGGNVFSCAISVAPVTDWIYYDTIYTERYMGLPTEEDNLNGYQAASLNTREVATAFSNKSFMLVHGTLDDNVHYQQAMMLARVLQQNDVYFTQMSYADEDHSLNGVRPHLYHGLERFLKNNLLR